METPRTKKRMAAVIDAFIVDLRLDVIYIEVYLLTWKKITVNAK